MAQELNDRAPRPAQSQSLYRKYRPGSFAAGEFIGQEHIARTLRNAIVLDRVAHAYLFCGPRGTGKTSTARLLAKAVNCLDPDPEQRPCNACDACRAINAGSAVDIIEIDAASNRGVDDIRDLREKVKYAPTQLRVKFYIIDEAHQLTRDAFNAFLKTLEEPPPHVKFVLATTEPDKLPDTVASRCQRFDFHRFAVPSVVEHLRHVCEAEGIEAEDEALGLIARQATGSMRDALGLLEQLALVGESVEGRQVLTAETVRRVVGLSRNERLVALVEALADKDAAAGLRTIGEASEAGEDIHQLNRQLVAYLRVLLLVRAGGGKNDDAADEEARALAARFSLSELAALLRTFSSIEGALNKGSYAQLPLEIALVESIVGVPVPAVETTPAPPIRTEARSPLPRRSEPQPEPEGSQPAAQRSQPPRQTQPLRSEAANRADPGEPPAPPRHRPERAASPRPAAAAGSALDRLVSSWSQIRREVKVANSPVAALLSSAEPFAVRGSEVVLVSPYEFHRNRLNDDLARRIVEEVIGRHLGDGFRLTCVAPEDAPPLEDAPSAEDAAPATPTSSMPEATAPSTNGRHAEELPPVNASPSAVPVRQNASPSDQHTEPSDADDERRVSAAKAIFDAEEIDVI